MDYSLLKGALPIEIQHIIGNAVHKLLTIEDNKERSFVVLQCFSELRLCQKKLGNPKASLPEHPSLSSLEIYVLELLLSLKRGGDTGYFKLLSDLIKYSDDEEKSLIMRGIAILDDNGELTDFIIDVCRTNSTELLSSIGLSNSYPSLFFPEHNFNQLVLKLIFCDADISLVFGLEKRKNSELARMALDYKNERIYASRSVPQGIELLL